MNHSSLLHTALLTEYAEELFPPVRELGQQSAAACEFEAGGCTWFDTFAPALRGVAYAVAGVVRVVYDWRFLITFEEIAAFWARSWKAETRAAELMARLGEVIAAAPTFEGEPRWSEVEGKLLRPAYAAFGMWCHRDGNGLFA